MNDRPHLRSLADRLGVLPAYVDVDGVRRVTKDTTRVALLAAMWFDASTEAAAAQATESLDRSEKQRILPPVRVVPVQSSGGATGGLPASALQRTPRTRLTIPGHDLTPVDWHIELREENGTSYVTKGRLRPRKRDRVILVPLPANPPAGYHTLCVTVDLPDRVLTAEQSFIVSPWHCTALSERVGQRRVYGLWTNLYTLKSRRNWGVGDLNDIRELARGTARHGAAFVGLNPLHTLRNRTGQ